VRCGRTWRNRRPGAPGSGPLRSCRRPGGRRPGRPGTPWSGRATARAAARRCSAPTRAASRECSARSGRRAGRRPARRCARYPAPPGPACPASRLRNRPVRVARSSGIRVVGTPSASRNPRSACPGPGRPRSGRTPEAAKAKCPAATADRTVTECIDFSGASDEPGCRFRIRRTRGVCGGIGRADHLVPRCTRFVAHYSAQIRLRGRGCYLRMPAGLDENTVGSGGLRWRHRSP